MSNTKSFIMRITHDGRVAFIVPKSPIVPSLPLFKDGISNVDYIIEYVKRMMIKEGFNHVDFMDHASAIYRELVMMLSSIDGLEVVEF